MIKYKADAYSFNIKVVEVAGETSHMVEFMSEEWGERRVRRCLKRSNYDNYFDTWDEARDFLMERAIRKERSAQSSLDQARADKAKVSSLKKP